MTRGSPGASPTTTQMSSISIRNLGAPQAFIDTGQLAGQDITSPGDTSTGNFTGSAGGIAEHAGFSSLT